MKKKVPASIKKIIGELFIELKKIYPGRLKEVVLYGSYARGDFSDGSDIDIAIILKDMRDFAFERDKYLPLISRLSLKYDTLISAVPFRYEDFYTKKTPLSMNISREGIRL